MAVVHPTIRFAGSTWLVKTSSDPVGPGPNIYSADRVRVDPAGRLQLGIAASPSGWSCAEVVARGEFGFGRYRWSVDSDVAGLDPHAVLGMFTWSDEPTHANRELDIEFSRWGEPARRVAGLFTVQNKAAPNSFPFPATAGRSTHTLVWTPEMVEFRSEFGAVVHEWSLGGPDVPTPGGGVAPRINLWLFRGHAPSRPQWVTIDDFTYRPAPS
ncbi:MAG: hypothetical protein ACOH1Y_15005 [Propionicimonas sp.]